jgi:hypothetical protein
MAIEGRRLTTQGWAKCLISLPRANTVQEERKNAKRVANTANRQRSLAVTVETGANDLREVAQAHRLAQIKVGAGLEDTLLVADHR